MKSKKCKIAILMILLPIAFVSIHAGSSVAQSDEPSRILIIPFKMNADKDLSFLQQGIVDMLATRLSHPGKSVVLTREQTQGALSEISGPVNEGVARNLAARLGAEYALFGSLTVFGNSVSIDAKAVDVEGINPPMAFFEQTQGMDEVIPKINEFAARVNQKLFGIQSQAADRQQPQTADRQTTPSIYQHPERLWQEELGQPTMIYDSDSAFMYQRPAGNITGFQKSQNFKFEAEGIALGDLDGDDKIEVVLMASQSLHIFRNEGGRLAKLEDFEGKSYHKYLSVDVADIKRDDRSEIFVTCLNSNSKTLESFVLEYDGSKFVPVVENQKWYYSVINHPQLGKILLGQGRGVDSLFLAGVYQLTWDGSTYLDSDKMPFPKGLLLYGVAMGDVTNENTEMITAIDSEGRIRLFTLGGSQEWKSEDRYGGSEMFLLDVPFEDMESRMFLPQRIFVTDTDGDGKNEVLVVDNEAFTGRLFKNYRRFGSGKFVALTWDGLGLAALWQTRKVSGYISDYALGDMNNDGRQDLVASVVSRRDSVFRTPKSSIIVYDLSVLKPTTKETKE